MKKVYVFYIVTTSGLFLALFAAFSLAGLGTVSPPSTEVAVQRVIPLSTVRIDYPDLQPGTQYSVSQSTAIWGDPEGLFDRQESLPPGGIFQIEGRDEGVEEHWYRITVNNGIEDYTMYLKAEDLNWQDVQPLPERAVGPVFRGREFHALMRQRMGIGAKAELEPEPEPEPGAVDRGMSSLRGAVEAVSKQGLLTSAIAAIVVAFFTAGTISLLVWFHRSRRWHKSSLYDERPLERGEEFYEDEGGDPYGDESQKTV